MMLLCVISGQELAVFGTVVRQLLGDAQQRIVFRAQVSSSGFVCNFISIRMLKFVACL